MDGIVTNTAAVHAQAWKRMFDEFLRRWEREHGEPFREFTLAGDYRSFVDGRPRYQGVRAFLESRGIQLPAGSAGDAPDRETICGLGNRKNALFNRIVETDGVRVFDTSVALIQSLLGAGRKVGLATSSRNASLVLGAAGLTGLFGTIVDGVVSERLGLRGKPQPDIFITAAANLGVPPARAIVVEDAVSGVRAGAAGGFGLVVGVARQDNAAELRAHGADVVVGDLGEISMEAMNQKVRVAPVRA
jgi:HAD superfamily hydrolase (TIGR01509 family)